MYKYYLNPNSFIKKMDWAYFDRYDKHYAALREHLEWYGEISSLNEDYLCAIYLSLMKERLNTVYNVFLTLKEKLEYIERIFQKKNAKGIFARKADPQFCNLAARSEFVQQVKDWIQAQPKTPMEEQLAEQTLHAVDQVWSGDYA